MTKPRRHLDLRGKAERAAEAKAANKREATIAQQYLNSTPSIGNLARAVYHWYKSVPKLGGQDESGNIFMTGTAPVPGMRSPKAIIDRAKQIKSLVPRYNAFAKFYGYDPVPNEASIEQAEKVIRQGLKQHNTFYRGLDVPKDKSSINKVLGKEATDEEVLDYMARNGSRDPNNTYFSPDARAAQYTRNGNVAVVTRKYNLGENPSTWLDDADFVYNAAPATTVAPKGQVNYPWAGSEIQSPASEVRINPEDYNFEGWLPNQSWEYGTFVPVKNFKGSKNIYFNEAAGGHKPKFKDGGSIHIAPSKRGTFTAAATKHGMGVQEFAARVLRNKEDYSPSLVKKANFARNASKWH